MRFPWSRRRRAKRDGTKVSREWLDAVVQSAFAPEQLEQLEKGRVECLSPHYLLRPKEPTKNLAEKVSLTYKVPFPICSCFSIISHGRVLEKCAAKGYKLCPTYGRIRLKFSGIGRRYHMMNIAVFKDGWVELFEPQTGRWVADLTTVEYVRRIEF